MANNLYNTMYNPDVLSCIANLSNDEVFTPPEVANAMLDLLPQELFSDPNGGVCYFLWDRDHRGECKVISHAGDEVISEMERPLLEKGCDVFIRYNKAISILHKVLAFKEKSFAEIVHPAMTFGFRTFYKEFDSEKPKAGMIKLYANHSQGYLNRNRIERGQEFIGKWKVFVPEAVGSGNMATDIMKPILGEPDSISTETYIMNGPYKSEEEAKNVITYINTRFFHFMVGLKKITQHTTNKVYSFVPLKASANLAQFAAEGKRRKREPRLGSESCHSDRRQCRLPISGVVTVALGLITRR